jgi:hypothetical protein
MAPTLKSVGKFFRYNLVVWWLIQVGKLEAKEEVLLVNQADASLLLPRGKKIISNPLDSL